MKICIAAIVESSNAADLKGTQEKKLRSMSGDSKVELMALSKELMYLADSIRVLPTPDFVTPSSNWVLSRGEVGDLFKSSIQK